MSNIEEDIELLKKLDTTGDEEFTQAIKNILAERKQDKARIQELEEILLKVKDKNVKLFIHYKNSIPKQKVKDKIEELKEHYNTDNNIRIYTLKGSYELQVAVLQELLEDK